MLSTHHYFSAQLLFNTVCPKASLIVWLSLCANFGLLFICQHVGASDESWQQLVEQVEKDDRDPQPEISQLKLGKPLVLDSQGQSMDHQAAGDIDVGLEFRAQDAADLSELKSNKAHKKSIKARNKNNTRTLSRKQQLASRRHVANDVSCRWLDSRMDHLEGQLTPGGAQGLGHHAAELKIRQKEWQCLKCGVEGPSVEDRSRCQHKR
jgi:hypothetical protein